MPLRNIRHSVISDAVKAILVHLPHHPVCQVVAHKAVLRVEIRQVHQPAPLDAPLAAEIDGAPGVVVVLFCEGMAVGHLSRPVVVGHHVHHHMHAVAVERGREVLEVSSVTEVLVGPVPVNGPVAMVSARSVCRDGRYPDGIHPKILNVVEPLDDAAIGAATVVAVGAVAGVACVSMAVGESESVSEQLVDDRPAGPIVHRGCADRRDE
mmetsp:Transcript_25118/g.62184  ORF Transcript_25118/g.62184 Transcript_25118/m.62184 type:complete len:209 (+) Transcript_25118:2990-3616(+)